MVNNIFPILFKMDELHNLINEIKNIKLTPLKNQSLIIDELMDNLEFRINRETKQERDNIIFDGKDKYRFWRRFNKKVVEKVKHLPQDIICLLYTSDAADEGLGVDLGGRRIIKKKKYLKKKIKNT